MTWKFSFKDVLEKYKNGDSVKKLSMLSDMVTIVTAIFTIVVGQILALKFTIDEFTFMSLALYIGGFGFSCLAIFLFLKICEAMVEYFSSLWLRFYLIAAFLAILIGLTINLWSLILKI